MYVSKNILNWLAHTWFLKLLLSGKLEYMMSVSPPQAIKTIHVK